MVATNVFAALLTHTVFRYRRTLSR